MRLEKKKAAKAAKATHTRRFKAEVIVNIRIYLCTTGPTCAALTILGNPHTGERHKCGAGEGSRAHTCCTRACTCTRGGEALYDFRSTTRKLAC